MSPPDPIMPLPSRRATPAVRRLVVVDAAHAARLFPERPLSRIAVEQEIARTGGAVLVLVRDGAVDRVLPLANGDEIADATTTITGAVAFQIQALPTEPPPSIPEPTSRDLHAAAPDVEVDRLRRVEQAARDLLTSLPRCRWCSESPATMANNPDGHTATPLALPLASPREPVLCDACARDPRMGTAIHSAPSAGSVRALSVLLADAGERAS